MRTLRSLATAAAAAATFAMAVPAHALILADIVWVVDTSGSMGGDIAQVKQRITEFNTVMNSNSIDARYGLVRFGGANTLIQNITTFADFNRAGGPFNLLSANGGGTEDGSAALQVALGATFRDTTVRNLILVTDENDDNAGNRAALNSALAATSENELINIIGNPGDDDGATPYYRALAPANGGAFFNILDFRSDPGPFFTNFINTKVLEIVEDFCTRNPTAPECTGVTPVPVPAALPLLLAGLAGLFGVSRRGKKRAAA